MALTVLTDTAAGNDKVIAAPASTVYGIQSVHIDMTTDATAGSRIPMALQPTWDLRVRDINNVSASDTRSVRVQVTEQAG